ncbi:hypothetical protein [Amycolatopsis sp. FDAARGOS 1241]|uniref:hypothetical protein n=1 Tax=Amycolatopsis sp. FDAARGOS 1241 TaxID=2778070 RepID=UPI00195212DF|nr:hypothetical protein [Amycolatopsis sp. FDAARGOS 1241]QRP43004.1 hypothetical protein I6J71_26565 [Amycolatopsis sp. FDAARGOS 1241]
MSEQSTVPFEDLNAKLDHWKAGADNASIRAAVTLLQEHEGWLRRGDFVWQCIDVMSASSDEPDGVGYATIKWAQVKDFIEGRVRASTSELAVLKFACALARDEFDWTGMGRAHRAMLLRAVTTALGEGSGEVVLDDFGKDIAARTRSALADHGGHPNPAWPTGEQLAVALVLRDSEYLASMDYNTPKEAAARVLGDLTIRPRNFNAWLDAVREAAGVETWSF